MNSQERTRYSSNYYNKAHLILKVYGSEQNSSTYKNSKFFKRY